MGESPFHQPMRRSLRISLQSTGMTEERAAVIVDLACHAAELAREAVENVSKTASDPGAAISVMEIGSQLAIATLNAMFDAIQEFGVKTGVPTGSVEIEQ